MHTKNIYRIFSFFCILFIPAAIFAAEKRPNVVIISAGCLGYSDLGCYGGEIKTPNLNLLAAQGLTFTQFYNCGSSEMSLASLMTGQYPHRVGMGYPMIDLGRKCYSGSLNDDTATLAEYLKSKGYQTLAAGKWPMTLHYKIDAPRYAWPGNRGVDRFYGTILAQSSYFDPENVMMNASLYPKEKDYYYTDAIGREAAAFLAQAGKAERPFFLYVSFTAPGWPLQAPAADVKAYEGKYNGGWEITRARRFEQIQQRNLLPSGVKLSPRDSRVVPWNRLGDYSAWQARRMEVYAAQVTAMDRAVGVIMDGLRQIGASENTLIIFFSDAGGCADEISAKGMARNPAIPRAGTKKTPVQVGNDPLVLPGGPFTFQSYGVPWANVSNTPFQGYAKTVFEGGIASPCIVCWKDKITESGTITLPMHVVDIFPTVVEVSQSVFPNMINGKNTLRPVGESWVPLFSRQTRLEILTDEKRVERFLFWESEGNSAVRNGRWKLVLPRGEKQWKLYNMVLDRAEQNDLFVQHSRNPEILKMIQEYDAWAKRTGVEPWNNVRALYQKMEAKKEEEKIPKKPEKFSPEDEEVEWEE